MLEVQVILRKLRASNRVGSGVWFGDCAGWNTVPSKSVLRVEDSARFELSSRKLGSFIVGCPLLNSESFACIGESLDRSSLPPARARQKDRQDRRRGVTAAASLPPTRCSNLAWLRSKIIVASNRPLFRRTFKVSHAHRAHEPLFWNETARSNAGTVVEIAESCARWL